MEWFLVVVNHETIHINIENCQVLQQNIEGIVSVIDFFQESDESNLRGNIVALESCNVASRKFKSHIEPIKSVSEGK